MRDIDIDPSIIPASSMRPVWHAAIHEAAAIDAARQRSAERMAAWQRQIDEIGRLRQIHVEAMGKARLAVAEAQGMDPWAMATAKSALLAAKQAKDAMENAIVRMKVRSERIYGQGQETASTNHGQTG